MTVYLLIENPLGNYIVGAFATYEDAEIKLKELTSKRCEYQFHSVRPNDYYIEEHELFTYCSNCNKPFPLGKTCSTRYHLCEECKNKAVDLVLEHDWQFSKAVDALKNKSKALEALEKE